MTLVGALAIRIFVYLLLVAADSPIIRRLVSVR